MANLTQRSQQRLNRRTVAEGLADVRKPIHISRPENEAAAKLKRILTQLVLVMARGSRSRSRYGILAPQKMEKIRGLQAGRVISPAGFVDQKRK
jgi:hypothetical protein